MRFDGRLKSWNDARGFGFIEALQGGQDLFVHISAFPAGTRRPAVGQLLSFEVETTPEGRKRALSVMVPPMAGHPGPPRPEEPAPWTWPRRLVIPLFLLVYAAVAWHTRIPPWWPWVYLMASALAYVAYAVDKAAARHGQWRTPEAALHAIGLAGGWPGALIAQQRLRHKTSKSRFIVTYWGTVFANIAGFVALHTAPALRLPG